MERQSTTAIFYVEGGFLSKLAAVQNDYALYSSSCFQAKVLRTQKDSTPWRLPSGTNAILREAFRKMSSRVQKVFEKSLRKSFPRIFRHE